MNQEAHAGARLARIQNTVHTLPRDWSSLAQVLTPLVERIDPMNAATQLLIVTPDVESTVGLVAGAFTRYGVQGIDILPATGSARAARLLRTDPARAVAGPPWVLRELLGTSVLRLDSVRALLLAWVDDVIEEGGETLADLETVLSEAPKDAVRTLVVRDVTRTGERFIERHLHQARRVGTAGSAVESRVPVSYVTTTRAARPRTLRRILDDTDPPSAVILTLDERSETEARVAVRELGYRRADDVVQVSRGVVAANTHTVILYDAPSDAATVEKVAARGPTRVIALVEPREVETLRRLTGGRAAPLAPSGTHMRAQRSDELLRRDVRQLLEGGFGGREIAAIEPLLTEYDAAEVAGALVRMLERERERHVRAERAKPSPVGGERRQRPGDRPAHRGQRPPREHAGEGRPGPREPRGRGLEDGRGPRPPRGRGSDDNRGPREPRGRAFEDRRGPQP